jgi:hypothetical protein
MNFREDKLDYCFMIKILSQIGKDLPLQTTVELLAATREAIKKLDQDLPI